jgi:hypothetical protein
MIQLFLAIGRTKEGPPQGGTAPLASAPRLPVGINKEPAKAGQGLSWKESR